MPISKQVFANHWTIFDPVLLDVNRLELLFLTSKYKLEYRI